MDLKKEMETAVSKVADRINKRRPALNEKPAEHSESSASSQKRSDILAIYPLVSVIISYSELFI